MRIFTYGCPPTMDERLARDLSAEVRGWVAGDDFFARLSSDSLKRFKLRLLPPASGAGGASRSANVTRARQKSAQEEGASLSLAEEAASPSSSCDRTGGGGGGGWGEEGAAGQTGSGQTDSPSGSDSHSASQGQSPRASPASEAQAPSRSARSEAHQRRRRRTKLASPPRSISTWFGRDASGPVATANVTAVPMFIPGTVTLISSPPPPASSRLQAFTNRLLNRLRGLPEEHAYEVHELSHIDSGELQDIQVSERMFLDHFPSTLEHRLKLLRRWAGVPPLRTPHG